MARIIGAGLNFLRISTPISIIIEDAPVNLLLACSVPREPAGT